MDDATRFSVTGDVVSVSVYRFPYSFFSFVSGSPEADARLTTEPYTRSWDDDEHLGLHDMAVGACGNMPPLYPSVLLPCDFFLSGRCRSSGR